MAGIYLHIPFCKQACHYCDFHFSTSMKSRDDVVSCMMKELETRAIELEDQPVSTVYFGGGTPSLLSGDEIKRFLEKIRAKFNVESSIEATLEANPDDLNAEKIKALKEAGINRLSIGIQSFREEDLKLMNRAHTASQADYCVKQAQDLGIDNISIDLIYAIPGQTIGLWKENIRRAIDLNVRHISSYCLTIEEKTAFGNWLSKGKMTNVPDEIAEAHFLTLHDELGAAGFNHYEVSNFCQPGYNSKHNSAYWNGVNYLGVGPSAHSFDGKKRRWNVSNNFGYIKSLSLGESYFEMEELTDQMHFNEYLMVGLRTAKGIDTAYLQQKYGVNLLKQYADPIATWLQEGKLTQNESWLQPTVKGFLFSDRMASEMFEVND